MPDNMRTKGCGSGVVHSVVHGVCLCPCPCVGCSRGQAKVHGGQIKVDQLHSVTERSEGSVSNTWTVENAFVVGKVFSTGYEHQPKQEGGGNFVSCIIHPFIPSMHHRGQQPSEHSRHVGPVSNHVGQQDKGLKHSYGGLQQHATTVEEHSMYDPSVRAVSSGCEVIIAVDFLEIPCTHAQVDEQQEGEHSSQAGHRTQVESAPSAEPRIACHADFLGHVLAVVHVFGSLACVLSILRSCVFAPLVSSHRHAPPLVHVDEIVSTQWSRDPTKETTSSGSRAPRESTTATTRSQWIRKQGTDAKCQGTCEKRGGRHSGEDGRSNATTTREVAVRSSGGTPVQLVSCMGVEFHAHRRVQDLAACGGALDKPRSIIESSRCEENGRREALAVQLRTYLCTREQRYNY